MTEIERIHAREVYDSRGQPTVEVEVTCRGGERGRAIVPSGASTGRFEAVERRDRDAQRLDGTGVRQAVASVNEEIQQVLHGMPAADQALIDRRLIELDGTESKSRLGANAILGASLACCVAAARARGVTLVEHLHELWQRVPAPDLPDGRRTGHADLGDRLLLPLPMVNMISGGLHAGGNLDFQDVLVLPVGASSFSQSLEWVVQVYRRLGTLLQEAGFEGRLVGDEGGYGPALPDHRSALEFVVRAVEAAGLTPGDDVALGLDVAASHFYEEGLYRLSAAGDRLLGPDEMIDELDQLTRDFPIVSIEDGLEEDHWDGWKTLTARLGERVQLIGDDLFVTNTRRLARGIGDGVANSVLVKINQIGTLSETFDTLRLALAAGYRPVVSARSGETEDSFIADLAVATGAGQIKIGAIVRSERLAKYNQLLRLEEDLGSSAGFLGGAVFDRSSAGQRDT